jgi:23S rRNA U2552 (ribose-2'-O)-methylase RlmE/FtsJ
VFEGVRAPYLDIIDGVLIFRDVRKLIEISYARGAWLSVFRDRE